MDPKLQERIIQLLRFRSPWIPVISILVLPIAALVMRRIPIPYTAEMQVYVDVPRLAESQEFTPGEGFEQVGRDKIIKLQEGAIGSYEIFKYVNDRLRSKKGKGIYIIDTVKNAAQALKNVTLGTKTADSEKVIDPEYQRWPGMIFFKGNLNSGTFLYTFSSDDPHKSTLGVQYIFEALVEAHKEKQAAQRERITKFIEAKLSEARDNLTQVQKEISEYTKRNGPPPNDDGTATMHRNLAGLAREIIDSETELKDQELMLSEARSALQKLTGKSAYETEGSDERLRASNILEEVQQIEKVMAGPLPESNPKLKADLQERRKILLKSIGRGDVASETMSATSLRQGIDQQLQKILQAQANIKVAEEKKRIRVREYEKLTKTLNQTPLNQIEYQKLNMKATHFSKLIETMTKFYVGTIARNDEGFAKLVPISKPLVNENSTLQKKYKAFFISWGALVVLCISSILGYDLFRETLVVADQIRELRGVRIIGAFPKLKIKKKEAGIIEELEEDLNVAHLTKELRKVMVKSKSELGHSLILAGDCSPVDRAIFTIGVSGALARAGASVLLVNTYFEGKDLVRDFYPKEKRRYRTSKNLKELISWLMDEGKAVVAKGTVLMVSVPEAQNRAPKNSPAPLKRMIQNARQFFDYVIVDSGEANDAQVRGMLSSGDVFLLTCSLGDTSIKRTRALLRSVRILDSVNVLLRSVFITTNLSSFENQTEGSGTENIAQQPPTAA